MYINPNRLSKLIMSRDWLKTQNNLLEIYECLTIEQRKELKEMFLKNKYNNETTSKTK